MIVRSIEYGSMFLKQFQALPLEIKKKAAKCEKLFRQNPFHPSLRLHKLHGKLEDHWSISVTMKYRIIFKVLDEEVILLISIGTHAIYQA